MSLKNKSKKNNKIVHYSIKICLTTVSMYDHWVK